MNKITTQDVLDNREKIRKLSAEVNKVEDRRDEEVTRLKYDVYQEKIRQLEHECDDKILEVTEKENAVIDGIKESMKEPVSVINQAERILDFLRVDIKRSLDIADDEIVLSRFVNEEYKKSLGYLIDDDYIKIKVFIVGNRKPKNKYTLAVIGRVAFRGTLMSYPYSYGLDIDALNKGFDILTSIKDMADINDLKAYYHRHRDSILADTITEYVKVKAEYLEVKELYSIEDFKPLFTFTCPECGAFYTIFDNFSSSYIPDCYNHEQPVKMVATGRGV